VARRLRGARGADHEQRLADLEREVRHLLSTADEDRRLHRRVAELTDIVEQRLLQSTEMPLDEAESVSPDDESP
jgi:hypothetical protein